MTKNEIREASSNGYSNWEILTMVIADGQEFPDAVHTVSSALRLPKDEVKMMEHDYDTCC